MMVVAIAEAASADPSNPKVSSPHEILQNSGRTPLLDNGVGPRRRPKSRDVPSSTYWSPSPSTSTSSSSSSSRRCPSPLLSRAPRAAPISSPFPKRSQSADRWRPSGADLAREAPAVPKVLFTSTRSLSVSFQREAFSLPISKTKAVPPSRKVTPERRRGIPSRAKIDSEGGDMVENSKPSDHRRPGRTREAIGSGLAVRASKQSLADDGRCSSFDRRFSLDLGGAEILKTIHRSPEASSVPSDLTASDTESVSSGSTSGTQECNGVSRGRNAPPRGNPSFWQETNSRLRRLQDPGSQFSSSPGSRFGVPRRSMQSKRFPGDDQSPSPRTTPSSARGASRPASASKLGTSTRLPFSPSRRIPSPSRVRNDAAGSVGSSCSSTAPEPSILRLSLDVRRRKLGDDRFVNAHLLRLLHNQYLQWRFVNARTEAAIFIQKRSTEKSLWNASIAISDLRRSVRLTRIEMQFLKQKLKLTSVLRGQLIYLEEWALLDRELSLSLTGTIEVLKASTLRLPVVGGAMADVQSVKDAIGSALNVMQAVGSLICLFQSMVEEVNSLLTELVNVMAEERDFLGQCKSYISDLLALQVKDCSLKALQLQMHRVSAT